MKILLICFALVFICTCSEAEEKKEIVPKKFQATFTVRYNAITLDEAAKREMVFRELYADACKVDVKVEEVSYNNAANIVIDGSGTTLWHNND